MKRNPIVALSLVLLLLAACLSGCAGAAADKGNGNYAYIDNISDSLSDNARWAAGVAEAAMVLRDSKYKGSATLESARTLLAPLASDAFREEYVSLPDRLD